MGPTAILGSAGSPTVKVRIASRMACFTASSRLFGTRNRVPAAQAWPLFMNARISAAGIARPRSASSSRIVGDLPPSSSVTRFIVAPPSRMIDSPTATEPVNEIFIHVRIAHELRPDDIPSARDDVEKALRQLGFVQSLDQHLGLQRA